MEWSESPSKRRRTSRSTSIDVDVQNTQRTTASQNVDPRSTRRALFMFPTTASLACSNPHLLQPVSPSKPQGQVSRGSQQPYDRDTSVNGVASGASGIARPEVSTVLALTTAGANGTILAGDFHAKAPGLPATPSRRPRSPGGNTGPPKSNGSLVDQDPRASPPEEARETANRTLEKRVGQEVLATDNLNTAANSTHLGEDVTEDSLLRLPSTPTQRQLYGSANGMGQAEDGEPSLPSTPTQLGLEAPPEKPKGLLFSSPSRRSIRTKCLSAKSSPLKPKDPKPKDPAPQKLIFANPRPSSLGTRVNIAKTPRPPPTSQETELSKLKACLGQMEKELQETQAYLLLQLLLPRVQQDNGKVNKEIQKRKNEVVQGTAEIMHLRDEIARLQAKISSSTTAQPVDEVLADKANIESAVSDGCPTLPKPFVLVQRLAQFLPFSSPYRPTVLKPPSLQPFDVLISPSPSMPQKSSESLTITISNVELLPAIAGNTLFQHQDIVILSPQQFLRAHLQFTIDTKSQSITDLRLNKISQWAEPELGAWLRLSSKDRDSAAIGKACDSYWRLARMRALLWSDCKRDFEELLADSTATNTSSSARASAESDCETTFLLPHLGCQNLLFRRSKVRLAVKWQITISTDGQAQSNLSAKASFPETWRRKENREELDKIGEAFHMLVKQSGVSEAVYVTCRLLFVP